MGLDPCQHEVDWVLEMMGWECKYMRNSANGEMMDGMWMEWREV